MPLVNGFDLIDIIKDRHVVAGAFNTTNLETTMGILRAVEKSGIPAFIQIARQISLSLDMVLSKTWLIVSPKKWIRQLRFIWIMERLLILCDKPPVPDLHP